MANDIIKYAVLGIGGYYLWTKYGHLLTGDVATVADSTKAPAPPAPGSPQTQTITTHGLMAAYLAANPSTAPTGLLNYDQWNWVYMQVRQSNGPTFEDLFPEGTERGRVMTLDEYWAAVTGHGLGRILNLGGFFAGQRY